MFHVKHMKFLYLLYCFLFQEYLWHSCCNVHVMHPMPYSSVHIWYTFALSLLTSWIIMKAMKNHKDLYKTMFLRKEFLWSKKSKPAFSWPLWLLALFTSSIAVPRLLPRLKWLAFRSGLLYKNRKRFSSPACSRSGSGCLFLRMGSAAERSVRRPHGILPGSSWLRSFW